MASSNLRTIVKIKIDMEIDYSKLRADNGHYITKGLFFEHRSHCTNEYTPYTLKERDHRGCISMYRIYMECETEYEAAKLLLNSWEHWTRLCDSTIFREHIAKWREEREIRDAAMAKAVILDEARKGNVTAAKAIYDDATKRKAGRPTKAQVESEKKKAAKINDKVTSILERMEKH